MSFSINTNGILEITGEVKDAQISNQIVIKQNRVRRSEEVAESGGGEE